MRSKHSRDWLFWSFNRVVTARQSICSSASWRSGRSRHALCANLGEALRRAGRLNQALGHLNRAADLDPSFPQTWNSLGLLAFDQGRLVDAERAYRESIRLGPRFAAAYINLGNTLHALGRGDDAAEALRTALRIEPKNPLALVNLGTVLSARHEPASLEEAETVCRQAVALAPQLPQAVSNLERVLRLKSQLVESNNKSAAWHFKQGLAHLRDSRHNEAETSFRACAAFRCNAGNGVGGAVAASGRARRLGRIMRVGTVGIGPGSQDGRGTLATCNHR